MSITKIAVFDFDDTLFKVPRPSKLNLIQWKTKTEQNWPHKTWWDKNDSLDMNVFDIEPKYNIIKEVKKAQSQPNIYTVLLSGRPIDAIESVHALLTSQDINKFDEYLLNNENVLDLVFKIKQLNKLAKKFPDCPELDFWDDRVEYEEHYKSWGIKNFGTGFSYFLVK